ncbi:hypothetical protein AB0873_15840 [Micromonospora sp. NPDC047707]|uniref:hypothetical protein n=1 Tax=Micromonospora sp. NPDC047707 TaxID=3154498 RepID=UPI003452DDDA
MVVVNMVEKFGADGLLERSWDLPPEVVGPLRAHVDVTPEGWVMGHVAVDGSDRRDRAAMDR